MGCLGEAERQEQRGRHGGVRQPGGAAEGEVWNLKSRDVRGSESSTTPGNALKPATCPSTSETGGSGGAAEEPLSVLHQSSIVFQPSYLHRILPFQYKKNLSTQSVVWSTLNVVMF
ncbi:hypothetical protein PFLUV_G00141470 [Perca fluviatilis]|uniref:Uncharacterized protein n=1 Tax=Perca fluviatilis TaxID=8168 RepID=A0A6A5EUA1_PERFL|nr:hypothetical protein PFLUV_G00141470 [Perca fluviatilis]